MDWSHTIRTWEMGMYGLILIILHDRTFCHAPICRRSHQVLQRKRFHEKSAVVVGGRAIIPACDTCPILPQAGDDLVSLSQVAPPQHTPYPFEAVGAGRWSVLVAFVRVCQCLVELLMSTFYPGERHMQIYIYQDSCKENSNFLLGVKRKWVLPVSDLNWI